MVIQSIANLLLDWYDLSSIFGVLTMRTFLMFLAVSILTACSTAPTTSYRMVNTLVDNQPTIDNSMIVIRRDVGIMGSACSVQVFLDGVKYGVLKSGETITIHTNAGEHIISARITSGICPNRLQEVAVNIDKNQSKYYRLTFDASGSFVVQPTLANPIQ